MAKGRSAPRHKNSHTLLSKRRPLPKLRAFAQPGQRKTKTQVIPTPQQKVTALRARRKQQTVLELNEEFSREDQRE